MPQSVPDPDEYTDEERRAIIERLERKHPAE